jgi:hypothetical protein
VALYRQVGDVGDLEMIEMIDMNNKTLEQGSPPTPFSTFFWAALHDDWATAEAQFADDIEWDMMPNNTDTQGET